VIYHTAGRAHHRQLRQLLPVAGGRNDCCQFVPQTCLAATPESGTSVIVHALQGGRISSVSTCVSPRPLPLPIAARPSLTAHMESVPADEYARPAVLGQQGPGGMLEREGRHCVFHHALIHTLSIMIVAFDDETHTHTHKFYLGISWCLPLHFMMVFECGLPCQIPTGCQASWSSPWRLG